MSVIYLICYGDSEENVRISFEKGMIGASNQANIPQGQLFYLVVKREGKWMVVGRANIDSETKNNPFKKRNRYKIYTINH